MMRRAQWLLWIVALSVALSGCDIPADIRLTGDPINAPGDGEDLDPALPANIAAYFYAGRPVDGLIVVCGVSGQPLVIGKTNVDGRFVCPRAATATFHVGVAGENTLSLGSVALDIFGKSEDADRRNNVTITPSTLYGTATDGDRNEVTNVFNLLTSLDTGVNRAGKSQPTIILTGEVHAALVAAPEFGALDLAGTSANFATALETLINRIIDTAALADPVVNLDLVLADARPADPVLSSAEALALANASLWRARAGLYRSSTLARDSTANSIFFVTTSMMVGNNGIPAGFAITDEIFAGGAQTSTLLTMDTSTSTSTAPRILVDGTLENIFFATSGPGGSLLGITGSLINDAVYGQPRLCNPDSPNHRVPLAYCTASSADDGFSILDYGKFESVSNAYTGDFYLGRVAESLPDIDLDLLPANHLPRTFEMSFSRYTDVSRAEFLDAALEGVSADKTDFGLLASPPQTLRYTLLPNGDIVSDVDADCAAVDLVDGRYHDLNGNTTEFLIGRVGVIFTAETPSAIPDEAPTTETYLDLQLSVMDEGHPQYGFAVGYPTLVRPIFPMVLKLSTDELLPKIASCQAGTCTEKIEWFNDYVYFRDVYLPDVASSDETADNLLYTNNIYYGQVTGNEQIHTGGAVCPALPPPL